MSLKYIHVCICPLITQTIKMSFNFSTDLVLKYSLKVIFIHFVIISPLVYPFVVDKAKSQKRVMV